MTLARHEADSAAAARAAREAERRRAFMRIAARVFRQHGLAAATMKQVAAAAGVTKMVLYRRFPSKDQLIHAIFSEIVQQLNASDSKPWPGYGADFRRSLAVARAFEDAYILLVRDGGQQAAYQGYYQQLRKRGAQRLTALLWWPNPPPPASERPPLLHLTLEPMISFARDALVYWVEHGDPARDADYIRWCGQMMRAWRSNAAELLNLDSPDVDWPFDPEIPSSRIV
ncbi:TetR/AcrR family transcriptional regulator [Phenylobacterium sp. VNQ135]|uniref:TetR/AcrR family transcriptional regulator n=1 Tax=Phenylobacterium sp. VNQ135 TaxID=3400922 RepID=UPI003C102823